jgi:hypothetical protein
MKEVRPLPRHHARIFAAAEFPPPNGSDLPSLAVFTVITRHDRLCREDGRSMRQVLVGGDKSASSNGHELTPSTSNCPARVLVVRGTRRAICRWRECSNIRRTHLPLEGRETTGRSPSNCRAAKPLTAGRHRQSPVASGQLAQVAHPLLPPSEGEVLAPLVGAVESHFPIPYRPPTPLATD